MNSKQNILLNQLRLLKQKRKRIQEQLRQLKKKKVVNKNIKRKVVSEYYKIRLDKGRQSRKCKVKQNVYTVNFRAFPEKSDSHFVRRLLSKTS